MWCFKSSPSLQLKVFITCFFALTATPAIPHAVNGRLFGDILPCTLPQLPLPSIPGDCYILNPLLPLNCIDTFPLNHTMAQINASTISVSGFSSGAYMTTQLHYSFSSHLRRVGTFAGGAYSVYYNSPGYGSVPCAVNLINTVGGLANRNIAQLENNARSFEAQGKIDPLSNINGSRVYIYAGTVDILVHSWYGQDSKDMYLYFGANVEFVEQADANHCVPTLCEGDPCPTITPLGASVNKCGYSGVDEMFQHLLGPDGYMSPNCNDLSPPKGKYYSFDQTEFIPGGVPPNTYFMAPNGYIYVPAQCQVPGNTCHLHIALHGCTQQILAQLTTNRYALKTCYTQAADKNNIILVFPQADPYHVDLTSNLACWDFCSGSSPNYPTKLAPQIKVLGNIIESLAGVTL